MDRIDQMLKRSSLDTAKTNSLDKALEPSVKHALTFARSHLNKYYSKTDTSNVYRIAIILHPKLKTKYFQQNGWDKQWIDTALEIIQEEWSHYKGRGTEVM
ncbi:hypothetical protein C0991_012306, partial [Blastosporella zonata]